MPGERHEGRAEDAPRTDLPPAKEPYYEGYFGTGEEEGAEREQEGEGAEEAERRSSDDASGE